MSKLRTSSLRRTLLSVSILAILAGSVMAAVAPFLMTSPVQAQALPDTFEWVNNGTIKSGTTVFYDNNPYDNNRQFIAAGSGTCSYAPDPARQNLPNDRILLSSNTAGKRFLIDQTKKDNIDRVTCEAPPHNVNSNSLADDGNTDVRLYQNGDTITSSTGSVSFTKSGTVNAGGSTGVEIFMRAGEQGQPCPDLIAHGTNGKYNGWFLFPMAQKDQDQATSAVSESYAEVSGVPSANDQCRVASKEVADDMKLGVYREVQVNPCTTASCDTSANERSAGIPVQQDGQRGACVAHILPFNGFVREFTGTQNTCDDAYRIKNMGTVANAPPADAPPPGGATGDGSTPQQTACDLSFSFIDAVSLKWIICPLMSIALSTAGFLEDLLTSQLTIDTKPLANDQPYHTVWASFRTIALAIIVIVALVMVIFQAMGIEAFSAYTMRTLYTRFGVAVIFIVLSWSFLTEAVNIINGIIEGARTLIYAPFNQAYGDSGRLGGGSSAILALLGTGGVLALGPGGVLSLLATAVLSIGLTVLVLSFVHAVMYLGIVTSAVFAAFAVLPGTRKLAEFAKGGGASLAVGSILAGMALPGLDAAAEMLYQGGGTINQILAVIMKILRVFLVIFIFSRIGGLLGTLTGMVNDRGRGAFDRLRNYRGNQIAGRHKARMEGRQGTFFSNRLTGAYQRVAMASEGGLSPFGKGRARYTAARSRVLGNAAEEALKRDNGRAIADDDATELALEKNMTRAKFLQNYAAMQMRKNPALTGAQATKQAEGALQLIQDGFGAKIGTAAMRRAAQFGKATQNTGYGSNPYGEMIEDAASLIADGSMTVSDAIHAFKSNKSRADINGASSGTYAKMLSKATEAYKKGVRGPALLTPDDIKELRQTASFGSAPGAQISGHHLGTTTLAEESLDQLNHVAQTGSELELIQHLAGQAGQLDAAGHVSRQNAAILADKVHSQKLQGLLSNPALAAKYTKSNGELMTVREMIDSQRSDPDFKNMRREYEQATLQQAHAYQQANPQQQMGVPPGVGGGP